MNQPAGWYVDPFNREQERYWDGRVWTMHERPPGSMDQTPPPGVAATPVSDAGAQPPGALTVSGSEGAPAPAGLAGGMAADHRPHRRRTMWLSGIAAAVLVVGGAAGVGAYVVLGGHSTASASEAVDNAATQSLNAQSADMALDLQVSAGGMNEHVTGSGAFDFANHTGSMTLTIPTGSSQDTEQVLEDGSTVYVSMPSVTAALLPGKSWISADASAFTSGDTGLGSGFNGAEDPASVLHQLQSEGDAVTSLGPTTFDGSSVNEYSVTIPLSQLENSLGQLPAQERQLAAGFLPSTITEKIYIGDDGLLRALVVPISFSFAGQSLSETLQMTLSNYGTPVSVTPPPADQVATLQQFEAAAGSSGAGALGGLGNSGDSGGTGNTGNTGLLSNSGNTA